MRVGGDWDTTPAPQQLVLAEWLWAEGESGTPATFAPGACVRQGGETVGRWQAWGVGGAD